MANRPVVLVYQEFAELSFPSTTPELNACVVGPAYQLIDYPEDRTSVDGSGNEVVNYATLDGTTTTAQYGGLLNSYFTAPAATMDLEYTGLISGAKVELSSVKVYATD